MWNAVRKFLRQDDPPEETSAPDDQTAVHQAATPGVNDDAAPAEPAPMTASAEPADEPTAPAAAVSASPPQADEAAHPVEVSPPSHAPQGLAAEVTAPVASSPPAETTPAAPDVPTETAPAAPIPIEPVAAAPTMEVAGAGEAETSTPAISDVAGESQATTAEALPSQAPHMAEPAPTEVTAEAAPAAETPQPPAATATVAPDSAEATAVEPAVATNDSTAEAPTESEAIPAEAPREGDTAPAEVDATPAVAAEADEAPAAAYGPVAPETVVGGRYTIAALAEGVDPAGEVLTYRARDARSYERCWSCGSNANTASTRFCQNCGAPIQDHPVTLVQTREATGEAGEVEQDGAYFHVEPERRMFGAEGMGLEVGAYSAEGPHHPNEDSYWYATRTLCANSGRQSTAIVVFADGMGGYAPGSGLISSRIASTVGKHILNALDERVDMPGTLDASEAETMVRDAIAAANSMVLDEIAQAGEMGATLVTVMIHGDTAYVANVGDSRAYYVDPHGRGTPITRDQSFVAQQVQQGHLAESDIYTAPGNNIILHAVGEEDVENAADWYAQPLEPGSYVLVCSDGYWKTLHGAVLPDGVLRATDTLSQAARSMVDDALTKGSDDNTTVVLISVS